MRLRLDEASQLRHPLSSIWLGEGVSTSAFVEEHTVDGHNSAVYPIHLSVERSDVFSQRHCQSASGRSPAGQDVGQLVSDELFDGDSPLHRLLLGEVRLDFEETRLLSSRFSAADNCPELCPQISMRTMRVCCAPILPALVKKGLAIWGNGDISFASFENEDGSEDCGAQWGLALSRQCA